MRGDLKDKLSRNAQMGVRRKLPPGADDDRQDYKEESEGRSMFKIFQISLEQVLPILLERKPRGLFFCKENQRYVAIDNSRGEAFAEEFATIDLCRDWLEGKFEVCYKDDDDTCPGFSAWLSGLSQKPVYGMAGECAKAIDECSLYYLDANAAQQVKNAIDDVAQESPYALADCIFQSAIDTGKGSFAASCFVMDVLDEAAKKSNKR